ncbi:MAG TPA: DUF2279 domain-containing protein [Bacteroidia bacterium]|nr:DUF2279 domain-containing protein [Bacteroidia bacterium]
MKRIITRLGVMILFIFSFHGAYAQDTLRFLEPAETYVPSRGKLVGAGLGITYGVSMAGLYSLWYKDYPMGEFHTFNDNDEWLQMDKVGHFGSAYYLGKWGIDLFQWTGMKRKKAIWMGGSVGFVFLTTIEVLDGFSEQWGFSTGDMIANTTGSLLAITQELAWSEQRIKVKFSYHPTEYPDYRPDQLGSSPVESLFKDYNGQTYWLSGNIKSFLHKKSAFPSWLNFSIGYGAEGMTGARSNINTPESGNTTNIERYRQFYIAPDVDLTKIKTKSRTLKTIFGMIGFIKFPAPAIEFNGINKTKFHWLYF